MINFFGRLRHFLSRLTDGLVEWMIDWLIDMLKNVSVTVACKIYVCLCVCPKTVLLTFFTILFGWYRGEGGGIGECAHTASLHFFTALFFEGGFLCKIDPANMFIFYVWRGRPCSTTSYQDNLFMYVDCGL